MYNTYMQEIDAKLEECYKYYKDILYNNNNDDINNDNISNDNINNDNINNDCLDNFSKLQNAKNPLHEYQTCKLMSTKRHDKYVHTYDSTNILNNYEIYKNDEYYEEYMHKLDILIDREVRHNCCNCITFVVYSFTDNNASNLKIYMRSIYLSVLNVEKYLNDWIIRIYFDTSVYAIIKNGKLVGKTINKQTEIDDFFSFINNREEMDDLLKYYNYLVNSQNVEIYTYICPSYIDYNDTNYRQNMGELRSLRFLTLIDDTVNACVIHEADGIVSPIECNNIKYFYNSKKMLYFVPYYELIDRRDDKYMFTSYSPWLVYYKFFMNYDYFKDRNNLTDILAGGIYSNIKISKIVFSEATNFIRNHIELYRNGVTSIDSIQSLMKYNSTVSKYSDLFKSNNRILKTITTGFDEMMLLHIFKDILSVKMNKKYVNDKPNNKIYDANKIYEYNEIYEYDANEFNFVSSIIFSIPTINFSYFKDIVVVKNDYNNNFIIGSSIKQKFFAAIKNMERNDPLRIYLLDLLLYECVDNLNLFVEYFTNINVNVSKFDNPRKSLAKYHNVISDAIFTNNHIVFNRLLEMFYVQNLNGGNYYYKKYLKYKNKYIKNKVGII